MRESQPQEIRDVVLGEGDDERDTSLFFFSVVFLVCSLSEKPGDQREGPVDDLPALVPSRPRRDDASRFTSSLPVDLFFRGQNIRRVEQQEVDGALEPR